MTAKCSDLHGYVLYKCNNTYVIVGSDGLDPIFGRLDELLVVGGNAVNNLAYNHCLINLATKYLYEQRQLGCRCFMGR